MRTHQTRQIWLKFSNVLDNTLMGGGRFLLKYRGSNVYHSSETVSLHLQILYDKLLWYGGRKKRIKAKRGKYRDTIQM